MRYPRQQRPRPRPPGHATELLARLPDWHALVAVRQPVPSRDQVPAIMATIEPRLGRAPKPLTGYGRPSILGYPAQVARLGLAALHRPLRYGEEDRDESA